MNTECKNTEGHLFKNLPEPKQNMQFSCSACGEVRQYDYLNKRWFLVKRGTK